MNATAKHSLGLDFGTESVRALLVDLDAGREVADEVVPYAHGVMDERLDAGGPDLPPDFALQHPSDYLEAAAAATRHALRTAGIDPSAVIGIGVDFTACTPLPVDEDGTPLCLQPRFECNPHAYVKLWKHHGAIPQAEHLNELARERGETFLERYGGSVSSEWLLPKLLETLEAAPEVLDAAASYLEASDWFVRQLIGREARGACAAGYKGLYHAPEGYPSEEFLAQLHPRLPALCARLLGREFHAAGELAGELDERGAELLGLPTATAVSAAIIDAHAAVPGCGVGAAGHLVIIMGTSACHMLLGESEIPVRGIQGVVENGILPGFYGYEAGQASFGDVYSWFVERCLGGGEQRFDELENGARALAPGESGLLALDWWNGNRSILIDPELSGLIVGLTLGTRPEEIYRSLIEATAFGTRKIIENFESAGLGIAEIHACGGIAEKSDFILQLFADITGRALIRPASSQVCALGAAILGAAAAGPAAGGFESVGAAAQALAGTGGQRFEPREAHRATYARLYSMWEELHDHFGRGFSKVMKGLRIIRHERQRR